MRKARDSVALCSTTKKQRGDKCVAKRRVPGTGVETKRGGNQFVSAFREPFTCCSSCLSEMKDRNTFLRGDRREHSEPLTSREQLGAQGPTLGGQGYLAYATAMCRYTRHWAKAYIQLTSFLDTESQPCIAMREKNAIYADTYTRTSRQLHRCSIYVYICMDTEKSHTTYTHRHCM